jgi:hypothetical protein
MALAKTATTVEPVEQKETPLSTPNLSSNLEGVPISLFDYFNLDIRLLDDDTIFQVKDIYDWASLGSADLGDVLMNINKIESRMGQPLVGEKKHSRIYNWVKINKNIESLKKQRMALEKRHAR